MLNPNFSLKRTLARPFEAMIIKVVPMTLTMMVLTATSGCLTFDGEINTTPAVSLSDPGQIHVAQPFTIIATFSDDEDQHFATLNWYVAPGACGATRPASSIAGASNRLTLTHQAEGFDPFCLWIEVTDTGGASATANLQLQATNRAPEAQIWMGDLRKDLESAAAAGEPNMKRANVAYPLYSSLRLNAGESHDPDDPGRTLPLIHVWNFATPGGMPAPAPLCPDSPGGEEICLSLITPGIYTVAHSVKDPQGTASATAAVYTFEVAPDAAPCITRFLPETLNRPTEADKALKLEVVSVSDDGDSDPPLEGAAYNAITYTWWERLGEGNWQRNTQATGNTYDLNANAYRTGDIVSVKVEVQDRMTRALQSACGDADSCSIDAPNPTAPSETCTQRRVWHLEYRL